MLPNIMPHFIEIYNFNTENIETRLYMIEFNYFIKYSVCLGFFYMPFSTVFKVQVSRQVVSEVLFPGKNQYSFPLHQTTTKASPRDQTHAREITGLELNDSNHMTTDAV